MDLQAERAKLVSQSLQTKQQLSEVTQQQQALQQLVVKVDGAIQLCDHLIAMEAAEKEEAEKAAKEPAKEPECPPIQE